MALSSCPRQRSIPPLLTLLSIVGLTAGAHAAPPGENKAPAPAAAAKADNKAVPSANISRLQAWKDAELIASLAPGRLEVVGSGDSMRPMYGDNTILVIARIPFAELQTGMTVAYTNLRNHRVVHQLLERDRLGWRIQGLNNAEEDHERVTAENLIGVVYASLAYDPDL